MKNPMIAAAVVLFAIILMIAAAYAFLTPRDTAGRGHGGFEVRTSLTGTF